MSDPIASGGSADHQDFYQQAAWYDLAFSYRDYAAEIDFVLEVAKQLGKGPIRSILELAAGPARHALEAARRGYRALALDASAAMAEYGRQLANEQGLSLAYLVADMRDFSLGEPDSPQTIELALLMIDSVAYLLTQADFCRHLQAVGRHMNPGGLYLIEFSHPKDLLTPNKSVSTDWEMAADDTRVHLQWGAADDAFDPIGQIAEVSVRLRVQTPQGITILTDRAPQRFYTYPEILALLALQGDFKLAASYGGFKPEIGLNDAEAWRMILVLERQ